MAVVFSRVRSASITLEVLFLLLDPLRQSNAERKIAKDFFVLIQFIVLEYVSPFFTARSSASLAWNFLHSSPIPPVVVKTKGVNVPCSIKRTLLAYWPSLFVLVHLVYLSSSKFFI